MSRSKTATTTQNEEDYKKVEYLILIDKKDEICCDKNDLINLINSHKSINISKDNIKNGTKNHPFTLTQSDTPSTNRTSYQLTVNFKEEDIEKIINLQRNLRKALGSLKNINVQTIWDDVSFYFAQKGYPYIYEIENLMRKLITKFMIVNVGHDWYSNTIPDEVKKSTRGDIDNDILYKVDFIHLSNFLFNKKPDTDLKSFFENIKDNSSEQNILVSELDKIKPKSNWDRYFKKHIPNNESELTKKWKELYELRCKIAHNNFFSSRDFESLKEIYANLKPILKDAIDKLEQIKVTEDERNEMVSTSNSNTIDKTSEYEVQEIFPSRILQMIAEHRRDRAKYINNVFEKLGNNFEIDLDDDDINY